MPLHLTKYLTTIYLFHGGGPYHIGISLLICPANQWTGFYMKQTSVMKRVKEKLLYIAEQNMGLHLTKKVSFVFTQGNSQVLDLAFSKK